MAQLAGHRLLPGLVVVLGRDVVLEYLRTAGVRCLFGVPGTNEIPLIDGTSEPDAAIAYLPCLHENIAMGAAAGYAWATGNPGVVELHVTPGAGHGIGNLYNSARSHVPLLVLCAQQHSQLLLQEPVLASDLVRTAGQYAKWAYEVRSANELSQVMQRALKEVQTPPFGPVFLSVPWDFFLTDVVASPAAVTHVGRNFIGDRKAVDLAAELLARAQRPMLVAGDGVGAAGAWDELQRLARLLGAPVYNEPMSSYMNYPNQNYDWQTELPQTQAGLQDIFSQHDVAFLCGYNAQAHVFVFDYANGPLIPPGVTQVYLHDDEWQIGKNGYGHAAILGAIRPTLALLGDAVEQHPDRDQPAVAQRTARLQSADAERRRARDERVRMADSAPPDARPTGDDVARALGRLQPAMPAPMMLADEAISDQDSFHQYCHFDTPNSYFNAQGGSLGISMPAAMGMKLGAGTTRTVVNTVGDGTALFYPHSWWTATKFKLPVLYLVTNNREYKTLQLGEQAIESTYGWRPAGDAWYLRLDNPQMSFVALAAAFGVDGTLVSSRAELDDALHAGLEAVTAGRPYVVEILTDPSLTAPADASRPARLGPP